MQWVWIAFLGDGKPRKNLAHGLRRPQSDDSGAKRQILFHPGEACQKVGQATRLVCQPGHGDRPTNYKSQRGIHLWFSLINPTHTREKPFRPRDLREQIQSPEIESPIVSGTRPKARENHARGPKRHKEHPRDKRVGKNTNTPSSYSLQRGKNRGPNGNEKRAREVSSPSRETTPRGNQPTNFICLLCLFLFVAELNNKAV